MKEINNRKYYILLILIAVSTLLFSLLGCYWNLQYYHDNSLYSISTPPLATAMRGIHDKLYMTDFFSLHSDYAVLCGHLIGALRRGAGRRHTGGTRGL